VTAAPDAPTRAATAPRAARTFWLWLLLVAVLALSVRVGLVLEVRDHHAFGYDATWFHVVANHIADGDGYVVGGATRVGDLALTPWIEPRATALFPPAYPAALSIGSLLGADTFLAHQVFSSLFGVATVVLIGLLGRRVGDERVGLLAALVAALHPLLIGADVALMSESFYGAVAVAAMLLAFRVIDRPTAAGRWIALGAAGGVAALTRNEGIAFAVVIVVLTMLNVEQAHQRARLQGAALAVGVVLLCAAPWAIRNSIEVPGARGISTNTGATVVGANCPDTYFGDRLGGWAPTCLHLDRWHAGAAPEAEFFNGLARDGFDYARDHPGRWPLVVAARVGRVTSLYAPVSEVRIASNEGRHEMVELTGIGLYYLTLGGGIAGFAVLWRRHAAVGPLLAPVVVAGVVALLHGNPRVRFAVEPTLVVTSAVAAVAVLDRWSSRRAR
jgi:dolichyl-phosphate-mannose-protein mannosyltransferase